MAKCKNCKHLGYLFDGDQVGEIVWCENITDSTDLDMERDCDHYTSMTNADKIRNMKDEELAEMLSVVSQHCVVYLSDHIDCRHSRCESSCKSNIKKWLQKESEE